MMRRRHLEMVKEKTMMVAGITHAEKGKWLRDDDYGKMTTRHEYEKTIRAYDYEKTTRGNDNGKRR